MRARTKEQLIALQNDERFDALDDRTRLSIIQTLELTLNDIQEDEESPYSREEVCRALRYLLSQEDRNELLNEEPLPENNQIPRERIYDPFYIPAGCGWDFTDVLVFNMAMNAALIQGHHGGIHHGCCDFSDLCGGNPCDGMDGQAALVCCCAACLIILACGCAVGTACNNHKTCQGDESKPTKAVKSVLNWVSFAVPFTALEVLAAYLKEDIKAKTGLSESLFWFASTAVSFCAGMSTSLIVSTINRFCQCLPRPQTPPDELLQDLEVIRGLLNGEWAGNARSPQELLVLKDFVRCAVQIVINGKYRSQLRDGQTPTRAEYTENDALLGNDPAPSAPPKEVVMDDTDFDIEKGHKGSIQMHETSYQGN